MFFAKIILNATFADNFNSFVGLAPVSTIDGTPSNLIKIAIDLHLADILNLIGIHHLLELSDKDVSPLFADLIALIPDTLMDIIKLIAGHGKNSVYLKSRIPVMASHEPGGTSMPNLQYWSDMFRAKKFPYDLTKLQPLKLPMFMGLGSNDTLANPKDFAKLQKNLPKDTEILNIDGWGHMDLMWADNAYKFMYPDVIKFINNANNGTEDFIDV